MSTVSCNVCPPLTYSMRSGHANAQQTSYTLPHAYNSYGVTAARGVSCRSVKGGHAARGTGPSSTTRTRGATASRDQGRLDYSSRSKARSDERFDEPSGWVLPGLTLPGLTLPGRMGDASWRHSWRRRSGSAALTRQARTTSEPPMSADESIVSPQRRTPKAAAQRGSVAVMV